MLFTPAIKKLQPGARLAACLMALMLIAGAAFAQDDHGRDAKEQKTATPIKHVIVIIGENRSFDNIFATYVPDTAAFPTCFRGA